MCWWASGPRIRTASCNLYLAGWKRISRGGNMFPAPARSILLDFWIQCWLNAAGNSRNDRRRVIYSPFFFFLFFSCLTHICICCYYFQVSWVRQSDLAILASGGVSHTSDNRITASADETLTDWELQIAEAQTKDSVSVFGNGFTTRHFVINNPSLCTPSTIGSVKQVIDIIWRLFFKFISFIVVPSNQILIFSFSLFSSRFFNPLSQCCFFLPTGDNRANCRACTNVRSTRNRKSIGPSQSTLKVSFSHATSFIFCFAFVLFLFRFPGRHICE